jgi:hypothetical protein
MVQECLFSTIGGCNACYTTSMNLKRWLVYITNNEDVSRHEVGFDIAFFIINTVATIFGIVMFLHFNEPQWIPVVIIEYTWALDNIRHNRS